MTSAFFLGQNVHLALELGVRMNGAGLRQNLSALDFISLDTTEQSADVIAGLSIVQNLAEHFDTGNNGLLLLVSQANDFNFLTSLQLSTLNSTSGNSTTAGNGEHVLNRHQEGQVSLTVRSGDIAVNSLHQFFDAGILGSVRILGVRLQNLQSRTLDDGGIVARELILVQGLADFHLYQFQKLLVVNLVNLVQEYDDIGHAYLAGQQQVLLGLSHRAVGSSDNQDSAVHLSGTGDHVLNIVGVAGAVNVSIVAFFGLILNVSGINGNTTLSLLGSLIDVGVIHILRVALQVQNLGDRSGQSGLAMVNVTDGANVNMGFCSFKLSLCHWDFLLFNQKIILNFISRAIILILAILFLNCNSFG